MKSFKDYINEAMHFKKGDKVEIAHWDVNRGEASFKGDTSVGEIIDIKGKKALVYDASEAESEWTDFNLIRKMGK